MDSPDFDAPLAAWLSDVVDPGISRVTVARLAGGHASGAWRVDVIGGPTPLVLKAPEEPNVVFRRSAVREGRILGAIGRRGAPVPAVVAIDDGDRAIGRPCFVMEYVAGRTLADAGAAGTHADEWLRAEGADVQRAVWESFHDALARLHAVDAAEVPDASLGAGGSADVLEYWRAALLDALPAEAVPRQLAALDRLAAHLPRDADAAPAVCMGDARLANALLIDAQVLALIDFEVAYVGNPAADLGYSVFVDGMHRAAVADPLPGFASADETWDRWEQATGRHGSDRAYWTAFGATVIVITATRAMVQWGLAGDAPEDTNPLVGIWESLVAQAVP